MNPGYTACTINVVHFVFLIFLSELQLKEQASLNENRSLNSVKLSIAITLKKKKTAFFFSLLFVHGP